MENAFEFPVYKDALDKNVAKFFEEKIYVCQK